MFGADIELIECQKLYNLVNEGIEYAQLCDPNYLYLIDCRDRNDYNEGHIICAKHMKKNSATKEYQVPYESEVECKNIIIVYDSNTSNLHEKGAAIKCARLLFESGSKDSVKILKGGYETFSGLYPFLRTQQIIYMPRELDDLKTYPSEIIPGLLYLGNLRHATELYIRKDLKIKSFVDCSSSETIEIPVEESINNLKIGYKDHPEETLKEYLKEAMNFMGTKAKK